MYKTEIPILRIVNRNMERKMDEVLVETPIELYLNGNTFVNIICLAKDLKELVLGFLFSTCIIDSIEEIDSLEIEPSKNEAHVRLKNQNNFDPSNSLIQPYCRLIKTYSGLETPWRNIIEAKLIQKKDSFSDNFNKLDAHFIFSCIKQMQEKTILFKRTGACHGAAVFKTTGELITLKEDVGRHNAIDKVIGHLIMHEISFKDIILTSTGRLTGDSLLKVIRAGIPIIASISAATESGIRLARESGITLIGFVRKDRMNIYSHEERIKI